MERSAPGKSAGAAALSLPYYNQSALSALDSLQPTPFSLGGLLATGSLKLAEPECVPHTPPPPPDLLTSRFSHLPIPEPHIIWQAARCAWCARAATGAASKCKMCKG